MGGLRYSESPNVQITDLDVAVRLRGCRRQEDVVRYTHSSSSSSSSRYICLK